MCGMCFRAEGKRTSRAGRRCSLQRPLLDRAAKEYGVQIYTDSQEMAASEQLDAVLICGNNRSGAEEGKKALNAAGMY